jgi:hypothetical protein
MRHQNLEDIIADECFWSEGRLTAVFSFLERSPDQENAFLYWLKRAIPARISILVRSPLVWEPVQLLPSISERWTRCFGLMG